MDQFQSHRAVTRRTFAAAGLLSLAGAKSQARNLRNEQPLPLDDSLIGLNSEAGRQLLATAAEDACFLPLMMHFVTQSNLQYCGVASCVMALNALGVERPLLKTHQSKTERYRLFDQENFFSRIRGHVRPDKIRRSGMTLNDCHRAFQKYGLNSSVTFAENSSVEQFHQVARTTLGRRDRVLIINFLRTGIVQVGSGHISPLGAYHAEEERLLMLDVARYKYEPTWVAVEDFWRSMVQDRRRGWIVVGT